MRDRRKSPVCSLRMVIGIIFSIVALWGLYVALLLQDRGVSLRGDSAPPRQIEVSRGEVVGSSKHEARPSSRTAVVLLQQSPVHPSEQLQRLRAIDAHSWVNWLPLSAKCGIDMHVVAAVPSESQEAPMRSISTLRMFPENFNSTGRRSTPWHEMVRSFHTLLNDPRHFDWITIANDHTFMVVGNLGNFLSTLEGDDLIYSGNQLSILYRKRVLSFASGGAGAVMSHAFVKTILIVWQLTAVDAQLTMLLPELAPSASSECDVFATVQKAPDLTRIEWTAEAAADLRPHFCSVNGTSGVVTLDLSKSGPHLGAAVAFLRRIVHSSTADQRVRIVLSPLVELRVTPVHSDFSVTMERKGSAPLSVTATSERLRRECGAPDKWTKINPGIVLAHCMSAVFGVPFTPSTSKDDSVPSGTTSGADRFNVYGALRTVFAEYDSWYVDAKKLNAHAGQSSPVVETLTKEIPPQLLSLSLSRDLISFHYVSEYESALLFQLLSHGRVDTNAGAPSPLLRLAPPDRVRLIESRLGHGPLCEGPKELGKIWPQSSEQVGVYSRKMKGAQDREADRLFEFLDRHIVVTDCT